MQKNPIKKRVPQGFTLVEMLIVITIIALMVTILFPVFSRARENARRTACVSNLSQIGRGLQMYSQDYDGRYPCPASNGTTYGWAQTILPYMKNAQIFQCPSEGTKADLYAGNTGYLDYFLNANLSTDNGVTRVGRLTTDVVMPTLTIANGDGTAHDASYAMPQYVDADNNGFACYGPIASTLPFTVTTTGTTTSSSSSSSSSNGNNGNHYGNGNGNSGNGNNGNGVGNTGNNGNANGNSSSSSSSSTSSTTTTTVDNCGDAVALSRTASARHFGGGVYAFADGHVKWYPYTYIYGAATPFSVSGGYPTFNVDTP